MKYLLDQSNPNSFTFTVIFVSNNCESLAVLEAFPSHLKINKDVSEYKYKGKDSSCKDKKTKLKPTSLDLSRTRAHPVPTVSTLLP